MQNWHYTKKTSVCWPIGISLQLRIEKVILVKLVNVLYCFHKVVEFLGAYDGIGWSLKREATRYSLRQPYTNQIMNAEQFFNFCQNEVPGIKVFFVTGSRKTSSLKMI